MRLTFAFAALAMIAMPAVAAPPDTKESEAKLQKMLAGRTPGKPVDCIPLYPSQSSTTFDRLAIVYESGGTYYVNRFENGCPELDWDSFIVTKTPSSQLCRGDMAQIRSRTPSMFRGTCIFGPFTPYERVKTGH